MGLVDSIIGVESGGNPNAQNPNSSAGGLGQFIDSTWLAMLKQERPDLIEGRSPQELLALKSDPALSRQMTEAYANQNGRILSGAGFDANPGNTYLAHFAGPQGAVKVLSADPGAPIESILGQQAIAANSFLRGMTAGDLQAWAAKKMGGAPPQQPAPRTAQANPAAPQAAPLNLAPQPAPIFSAAPEPAPQQQASAGSYFGQMPAEQGIAQQPILAPQRKPVDISKLRAALAAAGNRPIFGRG